MATEELQLAGIGNTKARLVLERDAKKIAGGYNRAVYWFGAEKQSEGFLLNGCMKSSDEPAQANNWARGQSAPHSQMAAGEYGCR